MSRIEVPQNEHTGPLQERSSLGVEALLEYVNSLPVEERVTAVRTAQKVLFAAAQEARNLDLYAEAMRALIDDGVSKLAKVGMVEEDDKVLDSYNAMSFNFAADLADCWPEDDLPREQRHFEAGLKAAEDCVRWRNELNKPPRPFSIAYWAKGMHLFSLGHYSGAVKSFALALSFAERAAEAEGKSTTLDANASFDILLSNGYLGLAEQLDSKPAGKSRFETALGLFHQQAAAGSAEQQEDAKFGMAQLEKVRSKYIG